MEIAFSPTGIIDRFREYGFGGGMLEPNVRNHSSPHFHFYTACKRKQSDREENDKEMIPHRNRFFGVGSSI
jgi:hypothetical protein